MLYNEWIRFWSP